MLNVMMIASVADGQVDYKIISLSNEICLNRSNYRNHLSTPYSFSPSSSAF